MMRIILQEDVPHLGVVGDLVSVKDGFGRNFLIPQGKAVLASQRSVSELEHQKRLAAHTRQKATAQAEGDKSKIEALSVVVTAKVAPPPLNEDGEPIIEELQKLFGSITNRDLAKTLAESGIKVDHRKITFSHPVRTVGRFEVSIRLNGGISAALPFWVIPEGSTDIEAEKKRVVAAQEAAVKQAAQAAEAEAEAKAAEKREAEARAAAAQQASENPEAPEEGDGEAAAADAEATSES